MIDDPSFLPEAYSPVSHLVTLGIDFSRTWFIHVRCAMIKGISDSRRKLSSRVQCSPLRPASTSPLPTPATPYGPIKGMPSSVNSGILPIIYKDPLISNNTACWRAAFPTHRHIFHYIISEYRSPIRLYRLHYRQPTALTQLTGLQKDPTLTTEGQ